MDTKQLERIKRNIEGMNDHFQSSSCLCSILTREGPRVLAEIEETLISQDAYIRSLEGPLQRDSALYQAKRLVTMLEHRPP